MNSARWLMPNASNISCSALLYSGFVIIFSKNFVQISVLSITPLGLCQDKFILKISNGDNFDAIYLTQTLHMSRSGSTREHNGHIRLEVPDHVLVTDRASSLPITIPVGLIGLHRQSKKLPKQPSSPISTTSAPFGNHPDIGGDEKFRKAITQKVCSFLLWNLSSTKNQDFHFRIPFDRNRRGFLPSLRRLGPVGIFLGQIEGSDLLVLGASEPH